MKTLTLQIYKAVLERDVNYFFTMSPHYEIDIEGQQKIVGVKCKNGGKNPTWSDHDHSRVSHTITLGLLPMTSLVFITFKSHDDKICQTGMRFCDLIHMSGTTDWYDAMYHKKPSGKFLMKVTYQGEQVA